MRRAANVDANHKDIVKAFREVGASVQSLAAVGAGVPDLLVGMRGQNLLVEVKNPKQDPNKRKLRPSQILWHRDWRGGVTTVETPEEARALVERIGS